MKTFPYKRTALLSLLGAFLVSAASANELRVLSYNIRYNNKADGVNIWADRKDDVARVIGTSQRGDIVGLQEATYVQISDLEERLPAYAWFGKGRKDGLKKGEFSCIFYRTDRFELLEHGDFWISETPDVPGSKSWKTSKPRMCTWGRLKDKATDQEFYAFNTHLDHMSELAREKGAALILEKRAALTGDLPYFLTGDLNSTEDSVPYAMLSGQTPVDGAISPLRDTRYIAKKKADGPSGTFTTENWTMPNTNGPIDYIFVSPNVEVLEYFVSEERRADGHYPSDHLPVLAILRFTE